jgi:hypothetical protein
MKIYLNLSILTLIFYCLPTYAQQDHTVPREKLYLHVDKSVYAPLDTLWFKAYLIDPSSNSYSSLSGLIYVDMINTNGTVVQSISLPTQFGISWGSLVLNPKVYKSGTYTLRSYTNWMQNFGDTYIFRKQIKIIAVPAEFSSVKSTTTASSKKTSIVSSTNAQDPSIQFLPEGGSWILN